MDELSRRSFIEQTARACLGVGVISAAGVPRQLMAAPASSSSAGGRAQNVIYLFMNGGMSHLDTFDPKPGTEVSGQTEAIKTSADGVQISNFLPSMAKHMDKVSLVRSMTSKQGAHERAVYLMQTSYNPLATIRHPTMGAWALKALGRTNQTLPGYVLVSGGSRHPGAGFMEGKFAPLPIGNPMAGLQNSKLPTGVDEGQFRQRLELANAYDKSFRTKYQGIKEVKAYTDFYSEAISLMKSSDLRAFDINEERKEVRDSYGTDRFGQGVLLARRLVEHGVRFVEVHFGGWDMHYDIFDSIGDRTAVLDQALSTLLEDLNSKGMLKNTLVVLATDFGRTPNINQREGRDHHPRVFSCLMAGGGIKGGFVFGKSDDKGYAPDDGAVQVPDFNATIAKAIGINLEQKVVSPAGRPFTVADKGTPIDALFA